LSDSPEYIVDPS